MPSLRQILPFDRWSVLVLSAVLPLQAIIFYFDTRVDWTIFVLYLVPVLLLAWLVRGYWWLLLAIVGSGLWYLARVEWPAKEAINETLRDGLIHLVTRMVILIIIGFLASRLRWLSRSPETLSTSHDASGMLSGSGLRETLHRKYTQQRLCNGPIAMILLDVERKVSAYGGQSTEHAALAGAVISKAVLDHARASDMCVRLSPNHFLVIMPQTDESTANTLYAALQEIIPEITRSLDDSISIYSLLLFSPTPVKNINLMRSHLENRLVTLKVLGMGKHNIEKWPPGAAA